MKLYIASIIALLLLAIPASATETLITGTDSYNGVAAQGYVYSLIKIQNIDIDSVSSLSLDSPTYSLNATFSNVTSLSCMVHASFYNKITGNTSYYSDTWYHYFSLFDPYFSIGQKSYTTGFVTGGVGSGSQYFYLPDVVSYAPANFTFSSDGSVDLELYTISSDEEAGFVFTGVILDIIEKVPIIGPYIANALSISGSIVSSFFTIAVFAIKNWAILLMTFETFVLLRAIVILQRKGKQSRKISRALSSIASDNRLMLEFVISTTTKIIELVYSAIRAIGAWIPFT